MKTIIVGDNGEYLASMAKTIDPNAFLIDKKNYKKFSKIPEFTGYVSPSDLPKISKNSHPLWEVLIEAHEIIYAPPKKWSDDTNEFKWEQQKHTIEFCLYKMQNMGKIIKNFDLENYKSSPCLCLENTKNIQDQSNIWIVGGSDSHGEGIDVSERYGDIISKKLNLPVIYLTRPGCSIAYSSDQILRSDISSKDIIIWGLTPECRDVSFSNGKLQHICPKSLESIDHLLSENSFYKALTTIFQVVNYTKKIGCSLIILPICTSEMLQLYLTHLVAYCETPFNRKAIYVDFGKDGVHPGPKQHQIYADLCLAFLQK